MARLAAAAMARRTTVTTRGFAQVHGAHERIEAFGEQLVDRTDHATEFGGVEVALHDVHHVLHQQIPLHLKNGRGRRPHETHHEIVAGFTLFFRFRRFFLVVLGVVERHFQWSTG